jgi:hypothetical protein
LFDEIPTKYSKQMQRKWIELAEYWSPLKQEATARNDQKRQFATSAYWTEDPHFLGLLGEKTVGLQINEEINLSLLINGDGGEDFKLVDTKGVSYWSDPWLKHDPILGFKAKFYAVVGIDTIKKRGWFAGFITQEGFRKNGRMRDWGYGPRLSLSHMALDKDIENLIRARNEILQAKK